MARFLESPNRLTVAMAPVTALAFTFFLPLMGILMVLYFLGVQVWRRRR